MSHSPEPPLVPPLPPDLLFLDPSPQMRDVSPSPKFSSSPVADTAMKDAINLPQAKSSSATEVFSEINNSFNEPEILNPNIGENLKNGEASTSNTPIPSVSFGTVPKVLNSKENSQAPAAPSFSWAERSKKAGKFPKSSLPVPRIKVPNVVFERGANLHSDYIVGIFNGNAPSYGKIWGVLNFLWGKDRRVTIHNLTANAYLFHIPSPSLRQKVLQHELWRVGDSPFFVTEWKASFALDPPSLQKAPVWVKLANVPFDLLTDEGFAIISAPLGVIVDAKPFTSVSEAEIKLVVDLLQPLMKTVEVELTYPWLPPLCPVCNELGHKSQLCPVAKKASVDKGKAPMDSEKSYSKPKKQAGASYIPKKKTGTLVISDGEIALESNLKNPVDESQALSSDLPSPSHSYVEVCKTLDSDVVSNPDQSSSDDASEDQECLVVTNFIRSNDFYLASSSSSSGSKQQKNKKRKLSKRSPGSGGHPHSHGGTHQN
uniref:DUF4283 domain-containing protein n=1 Tax=Brassica oleracea TaxID=3712 RepID=A0A3P6DMP0_BRAOL|nr:unnamed protein product [Brassica oleracea]